jgi:hypothetical protein
MDAMDHVLEVNRLIVGAQFGNAGSTAAPPDIRHHRVVTGHADFRLVRPVIAVQRELVVAVVTFREIDHGATCNG